MVIVEAEIHQTLQPSEALWEITYEQIQLCKNHNVQILWGFQSTVQVKVRVNVRVLKPLLECCSQC